MSEATINLERHLKAAQSKRPGWAVGLWGEAGVGKTFMVQKLLRETPIQSLSLHATVSGKNLAAALPRPSKLPLWAEQIFEQLAEDKHVEISKAVDALVTALTELAPFVLQLEDLHEVSAEQLEFIQKLANAIIKTKGVGLLVTSRNEPLEPFKGYRLSALSRPDSDQLLHTQAANPLPDEGLAYVFERAGGNALFTLEFWRYLSRQGSFWFDGKSWHWRKPAEGFVPVSLEALIAELAHGLDGVSGAVLEARAIFPVAMEVERPLWLRVANVEATAFEKALPLLMRKGLLHQHGFVHPLIREVVEREIPAGRKQGYAARALAALQTHQPEQAAEFIEMAGLEPQAALDLLDRAMTSAQTRGDKPVEAGWLSAAVRWSTGPDRTQRALAAARVLHDFRPMQAIQMAEIAASASNPDAVFLLAELLAMEGYAQEAEERLKTLPESEEKSLRWWESRIWIAHQKNLWLSALEIWYEKPELQPLSSVRIRRALGSCHAYLNQLEQAQNIADELMATEGLDPANQVAVLNLCGQIQTYKGNHAGALEIEKHYIALAKSAGLGKQALYGLLNHATAYGVMDQHHQARACLEEARALAVHEGEGKIYAIIQMRLAGELTHEGDYEQAEGLLLEAQTLLRQYQHFQWQTELYLKLARLYLNWQPPHGPPLALKHARAALESAQKNQDTKFMVSSLAYVSRAEVLAGNAEVGLRLAQECLEFCQQKNLSGKLADAHFAMGLALEANGKIPDAIKALGQAQQLQADQRLSQRFGLELDRITLDIQSARQRHQWFVARGLHGPARTALRYFPQLDESRPVPVATNPSLDVPCLKVLGTVGLEHSGQPIAYRGKKRLELLCYLLEARIAGRAEVSVLELADTFYSETPEEEAKRTIKQQMYLIRTSLGQDTIHSTTSGYALGNISSDAEGFLQSGEAELWRGAYLQNLSDGWLGGVREALLHALHARAKSLLESNPSETLRLAQILMQMEPYDLEFVKLTLEASQITQPAKTTLRLYQEAKTRFLEVGETVPEWSSYEAPLVSKG